MSGFLRPLRFFWWALGQLYYDLLPLVLRINLPWIITIIPLAIPALYVSLILARPDVGDMISERRLPAELLIGTPVLTAIALLLAGPGTAAMYHSAYRFIELEPVTYRLFLSGFRRFFIRGWILGFVDLFVLMVLLIGFMFYWNSGELFLQIVAILFVYFILFWALLQPLLYPLLTRLNISVYHTFRNAAVLVVGRLSVALALGLLSLLSLLLLGILNVLALLLGPSVLAITAHRSIEHLLEAYDIPSETDAAPKP